MAVLLPNQSSKATTTGKAATIAKQIVSPTVANQKGGLDYNTATAQQKTDMVNNWNKVVSDPAYRDSELARATQVKTDLAAKGLNTSEQDAYLAKLKGVVSPTAAPAPAAGSSPTTGYIQQMRDLAVNNAQAQAYDARNQTDVVNLQNAKGLQEVMANQGLGASGDNITATLNQGAQRANSLNQINNQLSQNINNLDINMAQQLQQQYNLDEDRALQVAQLMGQYKGKDTLAKTAQDWGQKMDMAGLLGTIDGKRTLQGIASDQNVKSNNLNAALQVGQQTGYNVTPQDDWAGLFRQISTGTTSQGTPLTQNAQQKQLNIDNAFRQKQADIQNQYNAGQLSLDQARFALAQLQNDQDEAYRWAGLDWETSGGGSGGSGAKYDGLTPSQVLDQVKSQFYDDEGKLPADSATREKVYLGIIDAGLSDAQTTQLLGTSGLSRKEIDDLNKKYGVGK